ncbi:MAG: ATP--guanido phosphotransferase [Candidatus Hydrogenedentota bacterium]|nr:MAG: ATP--guanido phosphotransferase [Candidatus Hydrogenedentota bacterium]
MNLFVRKLIERPPFWLDGLGPETDVVFATRIRLARNLRNLPFSSVANVDARRKVLEEVDKATKHSGLFSSHEMVDVFSLHPLERDVLLERHLVSRELLSVPLGAVYVDDQELLPMMVNEEDHIRLQSLRGGLDLVESWRILKQAERELDRILKFAFHSSYGYLTTCPTNVGTGLRASVLCHLPGLAYTGKIQNLIEAANQAGIAVRGFFGEGSAPIGNFFQFSNRGTLGRSEEEFIGDLEIWVHQVIETERKAREELMKKEGVGFEDKVHRALGILRSARVMTTEEMMNLLSAVRLGLDQECLRKPDVSDLNRVQIWSQPAHLQQRCGRALSPRERDIERANFIRRTLSDSVS